MLLVWRKILVSDLHCGENSYGEKSYGEMYCGKIAGYPIYYVGIANSFAHLQISALLVRIPKN